MFKGGGSVSDFGWVRKSGLVIGVLLVLMASRFGTVQIDRGIKTQDQYWRETGLTTTELETFLADTNCYRSERTFLACVNSIANIAEKFNQVLNLTGQIAEANPTEIESRISERLELNLWRDQFKNQPLSNRISFLKIWRELERKYVSDESRASVIAAGMNGFYSVFVDPHTYIVPLAYYEDIVAKSETRQILSGFLAKRSRNGALIKKVFDDSPAYKAGLRKGDWIKSVNGREVKHLTVSQFNDLLRNQQNPRTAFIVERQEKQKKITKYIELVRTDFSYPSATSKLMENHKSTGILTVSKFATGTCALVKSELQKLKRQSVKALIMDLRDNPGGQVEEAACLINLFVEKGRLLFETRYLDGKRKGEQYVADGNPTFRGPLAILINSGSASAAEIVAGALRDMKRATLVGERSFGKGTFQDGAIWSKNDKIAFFETEGLYYFPSGWTPQLVGLEPDIKVQFYEDELTREEDLFSFPIVPRELWGSPRAIDTISNSDCQYLNVEEGPDVSADPQLTTASGWLTCRIRRGSQNDRN